MGKMSNIGMNGKVSIGPYAVNALVLQVESKCFRACVQLSLEVKTEVDRWFRTAVKQGFLSVRLTP